MKTFIKMLGKSSDISMKQVICLNQTTLCNWYFDALDSQTTTRFQVPDNITDCFVTKCIFTKLAFAHARFGAMFEKVADPF